MIENSWIFPALEALHVVALALLVGTISLQNFRTLGWSSANASDQWRRLGLWVSLLTGLVMFASGYDRYVQNPAFWLKLCLLAAAFSVRGDTQTKAAVSLALWTLAVIAARAVIDFDA